MRGVWEEVIGAFFVGGLSIGATSEPPNSLARGTHGFKYTQTAGEFALCLTAEKFVGASVALWAFLMSWCPQPKLVVLRVAVSAVVI